MKSSKSASLDAAQWQKIDGICCRFEEAWQEGRRPPALKRYLEQGDAAIRIPLFRELAQIELERRKERGDAPLLADYEKQWPEFKDVLPALFPTGPSEKSDRMICPKCQTDNPAGRTTCSKCNGPLKAAAPAVSETSRKCPSCGAEMPAKAMFCGKCGKSLNAAPPSPAPEVVPETLVTPPAITPPPSAPAPEPTAAPTSITPTNPPAAAGSMTVDFAPPVPTAAERRDVKAEAISPGNSLREMVLIPAGEFLMGSSDDTGNADEQPQHKVKLGAYYIDRRAVSNLDYERFDPAHKRSRPEVADGDHDPVVMVSYHDCLRFCRWRAEQEKIPLDSYTLPTEAQWERAARGGYPDRLYPWGDTIHPDVCNTLETGRQRALAVDRGMPNGFQLFFMGSNVREWCLDCYAKAYYAQTALPWIDPQGPTPTPWENFRVVRGASFIDAGLTLARCAARGFAPPRSGQSDLGFRCVRLVTLR